MSDHEKLVDGTHRGRPFADGYRNSHDRALQDVADSHAFCSRSITPDQLNASAKAPSTGTTVIGLKVLGVV